MERNVVFTHELDQLDVFSILPPLFPTLSVVGSDGNVSDGGIIPDVEDLIFIAREWDSNTPFKISGDTSGL